MREKEAIKQIGERIREEREFNKLTQKQVAESLGISDRQYRRIENGESDISVKYIFMLHEIGFDTTYILDGTSAADVAVTKGLERMPEDMYDESLKKLEEAVEKLKADRSDKSLFEVFREIAEYGTKHSEDEAVRKLPKMDLFSRLGK